MGGYGDSRIVEEAGFLVSRSETDIFIGAVNLLANQVRRPSQVNSPDSVEVVAHCATPKPMQTLT